MEEVVVAPIEDRPFLDAKPASVPFVSARGVCVPLLQLQRQVEELPPALPHHPHQLRVDPVVHHLEEPPVAARLVDLPQGQVAGPPRDVGPNEEALEVDDGDVDVPDQGRGDNRWPVRGWLHVAVGDRLNATFR